MAEKKLRPSYKIAVYQRDRIVRDLLSIYFADREAALAEREKDLAEEIYNSRWSTKIRELCASLPDVFVYDVDDITFEAWSHERGRSCSHRWSFHSTKKWPGSVSRHQIALKFPDPAHPGLTTRVGAHLLEEAKLSAERDTMASEIRNLLRTCTTSKQLAETMPVLLEIIPEYFYENEKPAFALVVSSDELNEKLTNFVKTKKAA